MQARPCILWDAKIGFRKIATVTSHQQLCLHEMSKLPKWVPLPPAHSQIIP